MKTTHLGPGSLVLVMLFGIICQSPIRAGAEVRYAVTDLGTLDGTTSSAFGINSSGQIGGTSNSSNYPGSPTFLYADGQMTNITAISGQQPPGWAIVGHAINAAGQIAGDARNGSKDSRGNYYVHAAVYYNGAVSDVGTLGGSISHAYDVNDRGQVVGESWTANYGAVHAFLYDNEQMTDINPPYSGYSAANAINNHGQVVGWIDGNFGNHAFLYSDGVVTDLDPLLGGVSSTASDINDRGQVVGYYMMNDQSSVHPFFYSDGVMKDLGTLGGSMAFARAINAGGTAVGESWLADGLNYHAFVYADGIGMSDLNTLIDPATGWTLIRADAINDLGQIVGTGFNELGSVHAYLLTPVAPEPAALWVLLASSVVAMPTGRRA